SDVNTRNDIDALCVLERAVFDRPDVFRKSYPYTLNVVRGLERAGRLAEAGYRTTPALVRLFAPRAIFIWNGRYLPYRAISAACDDLRQLFFTSELGWIPGPIFLDRGTLSPTTRDLLDRDFDPTAPADPARADRFLEDY